MRALSLVAFASACSDKPAAPPVSTTQATQTSAVTQLAVGDAHTCALHADGRVSCWGFNNHGQLGVPEIPRSAVPLAVAGIRDAVEIAAAGQLTCARDAAGAVDCWGLLGTGSEGPQPSRVLDGVAQLSGRCFRLATGGVQCWMPGELRSVDVAGGATQVIVLRFGACAVGRNRTVTCWGFQGGELRELDLRVKTGVRGLVASGTEHVCARLEHDVVCWSERGGDMRALRISPTAPVATGDHTCFARGGRDVACFGAGVQGQLGNGWWRLRLVPTRIRGLANVVELAGAQLGHGICARVRDGAVSCWGDPTLTPHAMPHAIDFAQPVRRLVASDTLRVIGGDGRVHAVLHTVPISIDGVPFPTTSSQVTLQSVGDEVAMASHLCSITAAGELRCLRVRGDGDGYATVPAIDDAVEVRAGRDRGTTCVRHRSGDVSCFEHNRSELRRIAVPEAVALAVAELAQCAIAVDRALWCWGLSTSPVFSPRPIPVEVPPTKLPVGAVTAVSISDRAICVVRASGAVACWGDNHDGQLGDGTLLSRHRPVDVPGITDAIDVHVGADFACALHRDGGVSCWGATERGQVGPYATKHVTEPTAVVWPQL